MGDRWSGVAAVLRRRGWLLGAVSLLLASVLVGHRLVPNRPGRLGSLLETFLPWLGLGIPVLLALAVIRRSAVGAAAALLPAVVWTVLFAGRLMPEGSGHHDLTVLQHNVAEENRDPAGTARALADSGADLIALEELMPAALPAYEQTLAAGYPYRAESGTVGLWSRYPLDDIRPVDLKPTSVKADWRRGLRATARTPHGDLAVYVAHLPSVRLGPAGYTSANRDESAGRLGEAIAAEPIGRVLLLGDFNSTLDDRGLRPVTSRLTPVRSGFDFSWPAAFPLARIDQVMGRGVSLADTRTLPATGSDHLPVTAGVRF